MSRTTNKSVKRGSHSKKELRERFNRLERRDARYFLSNLQEPIDRKVYTVEFMWQGDY